MTDVTVWDILRKELSSPWDWAAATTGGAVGLATSIFLGGIDGGTSAATGALTAVSARKAAVLSQKKSNLRNRKEKLIKLIQERDSSNIEYSYSNDQESHNESFSKPKAKPIRPTKSIVPTQKKPFELTQSLELDFKLWEEGLITNDQFEEILDQNINNYRKMKDMIPIKKDEITLKRITTKRTT